MVKVYLNTTYDTTYSLSEMSRNSNTVMANKAIKHLFQTG